MTETEFSRDDRNRTQSLSSVIPSGVRRTKSRNLLVNIRYSIVILHDTALEPPFEHGIEPLRLRIEKIVRCLAEVNGGYQPLLELLDIQFPGLLLDTFPALRLNQGRTCPVTVLNGSLYL